MAATAGKPIKCRAAVARRAGAPLVMEEVIVGPPKSDEVRIKIICTSLCHSDVTFLNLKDPPGIFPRILGHEAVGVVESIGDNVSELAEGDTVIPIFAPDCGECTDCKSKKSNLCTKFPFSVSPWMHDGSSRFRDLNGGTLYHFLFVSSFTEYTVVHVANVTKIDSTIPPNMACLLSCGASTGVGAAWRSANVEPGSTVAIFGLGSIGLAVAEGARLCGAARIIGVDVNPGKFEISKRFGVTEFIDSTSCGEKRVSQIINEMTAGGADYCFECVGNSSIVEETYACCRKGWGKTVMLGVDKPGAQLTLSSYEVLHRGKTISGSFFGGLKPKSDIPILVKKYTDKELELDKFVTHEVGFEDINKAFDLLLEGKSLRCVIWMDK
ncbi:Zinc-binding alcohol dehydrogenase family protein [Perilla frutescens var. hirtella]|uniref:Zinc-binding alcohol dehydrogenase family protein n=1 Tax=Perilla frutescens var. hirtella TaxID=608512 RepID=A0AAD4P087_PERFH|nr:Zinc-binding alcohol dehydrogenase family protein [Perilla frutescens var. hirtella]